MLGGARPDSAGPLRGHAAWAKIYEILAEIETEWRRTLGDKDFNRLKKLLCEGWVSDLVP